MEAVHALSEDCINGHCDTHMSMTVEDHHLGHVSGQPTGGPPLEPGGFEHDGCNPALCHVLVLTSQHSFATCDQSEADLAWQVSSLSTLEEPNNPDRPPNL